MSSDRIYNSGGYSYYVYQQGGNFCVDKRTFQFTREYIGAGNDLDEALGLIRQDSGSIRIEPQ
jgi:hypothetical protein